MWSILPSPDGGWFIWHQKREVCYFVFVENHKINHRINKCYSPFCFITSKLELASIQYLSLEFHRVYIGFLLRNLI